VPDVIDTIERARELVEQLAATVPPKPSGAGWTSEAIQTWHNEALSTEKSAIAFLLEAVDWNLSLLVELEELGDALSLWGSNIAGGAWCEADSAMRDPFEDDDESESRAVSLAYWALAEEPLDPDNWRACDVAAANEVLPFVRARMRAHPDEYIHRPGDLGRARLRLAMFEPAMRDRRGQAAR